MKDGWTEVALGEVVEPVNRTEAPQPGTKYRQLGVRLWGAGAYERETIDGEQTQYAFLNRCESGDLVVNKIWARNGSVSIIQPALEGCFVSGEFPLFRLNHPVCAGWLRLITKSRWFWYECHLKAQGTSGKNRIKPAKFLEINIPLPPLAEQQRIVSHMDAIEERIIRILKLREDQVKELNAALRSAFHEIEADSDWVEMGEVAPLVRREVQIEPDGRYPELGIRSFGKGTFHKPEVLGLETTKRLFEIHEGDLLFSNVFAWEGAIAVAQKADHGRVGSHRFITCLCDRTRILPELLQFYFLTTDGLDKIGKASPGGAGRNRTLGLKKLEKITVPIPPLKRQQEFLKLLQLRSAIQRKSENVGMQRDALIPSLLDRIFTN